MEMKRSLLLLLLYLLFFPLDAFSAEDWAGEVAAYEQAEGALRALQGNKLMSKLYNECFIDDQPHFSRETPRDSMDKKVFFSVAEYYFYQLGNFNEVVTYAQKVADLSKISGDQALEGECESLLSVAYFRLADYPKALVHAHRDLAVQQTMGNVSNTSSALNTLAGIYLASKQHDEALNYIMKAIPLSTQVGDSARMAIQMGMAAEILQALHRSDEALKYAQKAYAIDSSRGNKGKAAIRLSQMAAALMDLGRNAEAEKKLMSALPVLESVGNLQSLSICHNQLGELLNRRGAHAEAMAHFESSLPFFQKVGDKYNEAKAQQGAYVALRASDPEAAMSHLERLSLLKDTLYKQETEHHLSMAHAKYRNDELQLQNANQRKVKNLTIVLSLAIVATLLAVLGIVAMALRNRQRRMNLMRALQQEKETFYTNITHEFRTPLTIILGLAQRLRQRKLDKEETAEGVAAIIERQGIALLRLVNLLLDIARTNRVSVDADFRTDDVVGYIHMVVESCEELARQKHISLQYVPEETSVQMQFVPDYLQKIVQNLVANAVKFTPDYGNVRVSSHISSDGQKFRIVVSDNGQGISKDFLPHVFDTFAGHRGTNGETTTGLGLALVKKIVDALEGEVSVESETGKGSAFTVTLPCRQIVKAKAATLAEAEPLMPHPIDNLVDEELGSEAQPLPQTEQGTMYSILVVEDNADVYYYMEHVLKSEHYALFHARNGEEGLEKAQAIVPDLIITDVMMPIMDGFAMCRQLKASQVTNHIPIIVVTARNSDTDKLQGLDCGAACYLSKPFQADELLTQVRNIFEQRRVWREKFGEEIIHNMNEAEIPQNLNREESLFITKVNDFVYAHMAEGTISVDALALHLCMSSKQLNRKLLNIIGYSVSVYIARQRMARACRLLQSTEERINVIAQKCGFDNPSNFSRTFKDTMNCSPSEWRLRGHR